MARKVISFSLSTASIDRAIREIEAYRDDFKAKCAELVEQFAKRIKWSAETGFQNALVSDVIYGRLTKNDVTVHLDPRGRSMVVIAKGKQAVFIEFGAGVYHNGAAGDSPHPWGVENGFAIGAYGQGKGVNDVWGYWHNRQKGDRGLNLVLTRGTPAAMPMYRGAEEAVRALSEIVQEVFGS